VETEEPAQNEPARAQGVTFRLLIDECLSPGLVDLAVDAGHVESTCLRNRELLATKDWELMRYIFDNDFTLVTVNARDFRGGGEDAPGGLYATTELHAVLVCMSSARAMDIRAQGKLFAIALEALAGIPDLINQVLEVMEDESGEVFAKVYELPARATVPDPNRPPGDR
jgi:hypothetical protein